VKDNKEGEELVRVATLSATTIGLDICSAAISAVSGSQIGIFKVASVTAAGTSSV
jgi:hypothetical protein